jgi:hypothetical protein
MKPAAYEIARPAAPVDYFVMAASTAEVSRPTSVARFLPVDVATPEPCILPVAIHAEGDVSKRACFVIHESMAGVESPFCRDSEITGPSTAGIRAVRPTVNFAHGVGDIGEGITATGNNRRFKTPPTLAHFFEHPGQIRCVHESAAVR